jgi:NTE family protein
MTDGRLTSSKNAAARRFPKRVGLALGGGLVRGMAHIGVLKVLEEAGIPVDFISGTSAGAMVAAAYAAGMNSDRLRDFSLRLGWFRLLRPVWPVRGFLSFDPLGRLLARELGDPDFSDLGIPLAVVATDMELGVPIELSAGKVVPAVQASCSVPGFIAPYELDGRLLCDGGVTDMLPVKVLRDMGADYVIGVDVFVFDLRRFLGPFGYMAATIELLLERAGEGVTQADCLISPDLKGKTYLRFSRRDQLIELGRQAALAKIDCIRADLHMGTDENSLPE